MWTQKFPLKFDSGHPVKWPVLLFSLLENVHRVVCKLKPPISMYQLNSAAITYIMMVDHQHFIVYSLLTATKMQVLYLM